MTRQKMIEELVSKLNWEGGIDGYFRDYGANPEVIDGLGLRSLVDNYTKAASDLENKLSELEYELIQEEEDEVDHYSVYGDINDL